MIIAPLTAIINAAKGNASIPHWLHCVSIGISALAFADKPLLWFYVVMVMTILPTGRLFTKDTAAFRYGALRASLAVIPTVLITQNPLYFILLFQGLLYTYCLKFNQYTGVRNAEYVSGFILGTLA